MCTGTPPLHYIMQQWDAKTVPQARFAFRPATTPRWSGTLRTVLYSAKILLRQILVALRLSINLMRWLRTLGRFVGNGLDRSVQLN